MLKKWEDCGEIKNILYLHRNNADRQREIRGGFISIFESEYLSLFLVVNKLNLWDKEDWERVDGMVVFNYISG